MGKKARKKVRTREENLEFLFETPLTDLDPQELPKKCDTVRFYMHIYDSKRGDSRIMKESHKKEVKNQVSFWC